MKSRSLSVVLPAYNDAYTIGGVVSSVIANIKPFVNSLEIIIVEDGSSDDTAEVCKALVEKYPNVKVISHSCNLGYGFTLRDGFDNAKNELVFYTDGDNQFDLRDLRRALEVLEQFSMDAVLGFRQPRSDGMCRFLVSKIYNLLFRAFFFTFVRDVNCSFKLIKKEVIRKLNLSSTSAFIDAEIVWKLKKNGFKFKEVPISHFANKYRCSHFINPKLTLEMLNEMFRKRCNL